MKGKYGKGIFFLCLYACLLLIMLSSCVFFPKTRQEDLEVSDCRLRMPEWELRSEMIDVSNACVGVTNKYDALGCLASIGIVIPAGSFIVSGSIVVTGNTIRWLEYQGRCEEGVLSKSLALLKASEDEQITEASKTK